MLNLSLVGCLAPEDNRTVIEEPTIFDFERPIPETTWYHYSGGINALDPAAVEQANLTANLFGNNVPFFGGILENTRIVVETLGSEGLGLIIAIIIILSVWNSRSS